MALRVLEYEVGTPETFSSLGPSLSLVLFDLDDCSHSKMSDHQMWAKLICDVFDAPTRPISEVIVPFEWAEIEAIVIQGFKASEIVQNGSIDEADLHPRWWWSFFRKLAEHGVPIRDRIGTSLKEGSGAMFVQCMEALINGEEYMEKRWMIVEEQDPLSRDERDDQDEEDENEEEDEDEDDDDGEDIDTEDSGER
ncbi:hypothetical protein FRC17_010384 [Serendipita sp. 399]|nr:hypothetical protein FRC17_010384 [Serendipita sp. 399]